MRLIVIAALALGLAACEPPAADPQPAPGPLPTSNPDCPPDTQCVEP
jgi:hypothetical protein